MTNMSYCRWQNTRQDLQECLASYDEDRPLSDDERHAMVGLVLDMCEWLQDNNIIDGFNIDELDGDYSD